MIFRITWGAAEPAGVEDPAPKKIDGGDGAEIRQRAPLPTAWAGDDPVREACVVQASDAHGGSTSIKSPSS